MSANRVQIGMGNRTATSIEQKQVLSVRLQRSLELLAMTSTELDVAIASELEQNPTLERIEGSLKDDRAAEISPDSRELSKERADTLEDFYWASFADNAPVKEQNISDASEFDILANQAAPGESLSEHLIRQLELSVTDGSDFELAVEIATSLDSDGYLRLSTDYLAAEMGVKNEDIKRVLVEYIQECDPPGVGARSLRECLFIQAKSSASNLAVAIIESYLDNVAKNDIERIIGDTGASREEIEAAITEIRTLEPIPARQFGTTKTEYLIPDIFVDFVDGELKITIKDSGRGQLRISRYYRNMIRNDENLDAESRKYIHERIRSSIIFIRSLHNRRKTIERVVRAVFERQIDFFELGSLGLVPLTMDEVALELDINTSTVSRTVSGKTVDTPHGFYPLKFFFTGGVKGEGGIVATEGVKARIKQFVADEDKTRPLSDDAIVELLQNDGISIARRTVAKYRKELRIMPKHIRKEK